MRMTTRVGDARDAETSRDLVARCRRGDPEAWPQFVRRFAPYVHTIAAHGYRLSEQDAQDVFQEVFLRAWTRLDTLRDDAAVQPWLAQLTRRLAIDRLRSRAREAVRETVRDDLDDLRHVPTEDPLEALEEALIVREAIDSLPAIHRDIVDRFFVEGQSYATIAAELGVAEGTVSSRICRAVDRLRLQLAA
jgi:RNA polymerase sigma-70 factor, ECF subfamily